MGSNKNPPENQLSKAKEKKKNKQNRYVQLKSIEQTKYWFKEKPNKQTVIMTMNETEWMNKLIASYEVIVFF